MAKSTICLAPRVIDATRPECVLVTRSGDLFMSDARGGVFHLRPDGSSHLITDPTRPKDFLPNGIALLRDGALLIANLGQDGGIWRLEPTGELSPWLMTVDGLSLPPSNFVGLDHFGRIWVTVSTLLSPRVATLRHGGKEDGIIVVIDDRGARIAAEGFAFTNEAKVDPSGKWLYVVETAGRRLTRLALSEDGRLSSRETIASFGHGTFPDGLAFDANGDVWVTSVVSNRLLRVSRATRTTHVEYEDADPDLIDVVEEKFSAGLYPDPPGMYGISSLAFGGSDLRTVYVGYCKGNQIASYRSAVAGVPPPHWEFSA